MNIDALQYEIKEVTLIEQRDQFSKRNPEQTQVVNGREWGVIKKGNSGPALLLIPGTLGRADIFWQQIEKISDRAQILSVTYPNTHDIAEWAEDLVLMLDHYEIESATVLGSSLGGYLAQYIAATYPERTNGLIAANTLSSVAGLTEKPPYSADIANTPIEILRDGFLAGIKARAHEAPEYQALTEMLVSEVEGRIPADHLKARLLALKHAPQIPDITIGSEKIVVIESEDDPLIVKPVRNKVRKMLSPSVTYRFEHGGHFPYVVRPDAYLSILEECLGLEITGENWGEGVERQI